MIDADLTMHFDGVPNGRDDAVGPSKKDTKGQVGWLIASNEGFNLIAWVGDGLNNLKYGPHEPGRQPDMAVLQSLVRTALECNRHESCEVPHLQALNRMLLRGTARGITTHETKKP